MRMDCQHLTLSQALCSCYLFSEGCEFSKLDFIHTLAKNLRTMDFAVMSEGIHHAKHSTTNVPEALKTCTHVWVWVDRVWKALEAPYTSPFEVLERHDRTFTIMLLNGKSERISIGCFKAQLFSCEIKLTDITKHWIIANPHRCAQTRNPVNKVHPTMMMTIASATQQIKILRCKLLQNPQSMMPHCPMICMDVFNATLAVGIM